MKISHSLKNSWKYVKTLSLLAASGFQNPSPAQAQSDIVTTFPGQIVALQSDWNSNAMLVSLSSSVPFANPAACGFTDYYETNPTDAGIQLNNSILLTAYMAHSTVKFTIQGCSAGQRPRIIGITVVN